MYTSIDILLTVRPLNTHFNQVLCNLRPPAYQASTNGVTSIQVQSYDVLELLERLGNFLQRLEIYTRIPSTTMMTDIVVKIMVEVLSVLALATKQIKQGRLGRCTIT